MPVDVFLLQLQCLYICLVNPPFSDTPKNITSSRLYTSHKTSPFLVYQCLLYIYLSIYLLYYILYIIYYVLYIIYYILWIGGYVRYIPWSCWMIDCSICSQWPVDGGFGMGSYFPGLLQLGVLSQRFTGCVTFDWTLHDCTLCGDVKVFRSCIPIHTPHVWLTLSTMRRSSTFICPMLCWIKVELLIYNAACYML